MAYSPSDFGLDKNGPQFAWLDIRLDLHGFPSKRLLDDLKDRTQRFQWAQGWTGNGADGLIGPRTLALLSAEPKSRGIDLSIWKVTLPTGEEDHPTEWYPIGTHEDAPLFVNHGDAGLTFRAPVDGVTTSGSSYPRSELREMYRDGRKADWPSGRGTHTLNARLAITHLPGRKPHVVCAQIHDNVDDVIMVRLEGKRLFVESPYDEDNDLDTNYQLGTPFDLSIVAGPAGIKVIYNGTKSVSLDGLVRSGCYFKAGCYTQANESNGDGYGEVIIYALNVTHAA